MTQGILLFAHDNEQIQYSLLAAWQARRIHKWLNKPVSIVTDLASAETLKQQNLDTLFDHVIISDAETAQQKIYTGELLTFKNVNRTHAYELTPYDETLVIDTDIAIQSDRLNLVWNNVEDYLVCGKCSDVFNRKWTALEYVHQMGIKFYWATLFYFKKTPQARQFIERCRHIQENYQEYIARHGIRDEYLRNDHVWSIAINQLGGVEIPTTLWFSIQDDPIVQMTEDTVIFEQAKIQGQDVHIMHKFSLMEHVKRELGSE
jgi:hypothetical protein